MVCSLLQCITYNVISLAILTHHHQDLSRAPLPLQLEGQQQRIEPSWLVRIYSSCTSCSALIEKGCTSTSTKSSSVRTQTCPLKYIKAVLKKKGQTLRGTPCHVPETSRITCIEKLKITQRAYFFKVYLSYGPQLWTFKKNWLCYRHLLGPSTARIMSSPYRREGWT
jgi:hypothetical protein